MVWPNDQVALLVLNKGTSNRAAQVYRPYDRVPKDGIYIALHVGQAAGQEHTLLAGQLFPVCAECGENVRFEAVRIAPRLNAEKDFRIRLYVIPHPKEEQYLPKTG